MDDSWIFFFSKTPHARRGWRGVIIFIVVTVSQVSHYLIGPWDMHRKVSNIRRTKSQNLNDSRLVLQLSLPNRLKPGVKSRMKM